MSEVRHLDAPSLAALLADPEGQAELLAHLAADCEICDSFLAAHAGPGVLDGVVDAALMTLSPQPEELLHQQGYARLRLEGATPKKMRVRWPYAAAALAAAGLAFALHVPEAGPDRGLKGPARERVELQALWQATDGSLLPLGPGAEVPAHGAVLFRVRSPRAGQALLLVQRGASAPELLRATAVSSGLEDLRSEGGALGLSLEGEAGSVAVWLVVGDDRTLFILELVRAALHSGASNALAVGRFEFHVKP